MNLSAERLEELKSLTVDRLVNMTSDEFDQVVDDEIRRMDDGSDRDALIRLLKDPAVADRWQIVLVGMKKSVEGQLGYKRSDVQRARLAFENDPNERTREFFLYKREEFLRWRGGSLRFKNGVEARLNDIRKIQYAAAKGNDLVSAILGHKEKVLREFPDEVSDADRELWRKAAV